MRGHWSSTLAQWKSRWCSWCAQFGKVDRSCFVEWNSGHWDRSNCQWICGRCQAPARKREKLVHWLRKGWNISHHHHLLSWAKARSDRLESSSRFSPLIEHNPSWKAAPRLRQARPSRSCSIAFGAPDGARTRTLQRPRLVLFDALGPLRLQDGLADIDALMRHRIDQQGLKSLVASLICQVKLQVHPKVGNDDESYAVCCTSVTI